MAITFPANSLWVVTDLDGTLLDEERYTCDAARPALDALAAARVPLVLATSKTRAEVEHFAATIMGNPMYIVENGGEVVVPAERSPTYSNGASMRQPLIIELGVRRHLLLMHLADIAEETGARLRGFAHLSLEETMALTGLPEMLARFARDRHYDEPFLLEQGRLPPLVAAASRRGLRVTHGGRWHHLTGDTDKGMALTVLRQRVVLEGRRPFMVGLGDAANDLSFLRVVDRPIVIPRPNGVDPGLASALPHAERTPKAGPAGWNAAILAVLAGRLLPRVS
jgi:mannosyl-3-phosphoglycerate phosphatase